MSKKADPALIGGFVLLALALLGVGLFYLSAGRFTASWIDLVLYFRHDVSGLQVGAPVVLQGVQVGRVSDIRVKYHVGQHRVLVPVYIRVNRDAVIWPGEQQDITAAGMHDLLVQRGLRGRLALQSLVTSRLMVELGFFPDSPVLFQSPPAERSSEIPTIPSELDEFRQVLGDLPLREIAASLERVLTGLDRFLNDPSAQALPGQLTQLLAQIQRLAENLDQQVEPLGREMRAAAGEAKRLAGDLDALTLELGGAMRDMVLAVTRLAQHADAQVEPLAAELRGAARATHASLGAAHAAFDQATALLADDSPVRAELLETLRRVADAARSLDTLAEYLERHPEALLQGKR